MSIQFLNNEELYKECGGVRVCTINAAKSFGDVQARS